MKEILVVIVLYKSIIRETITYQTLISRYCDIALYVYDNSPHSQSLSISNAIYVHDSQNRGVSVAYNSACLYAKENGYDWILLLDQDTNFANISIEDYIYAISTHPEIKIFAPKVKTGDKYMSPIKVWNHLAVLQKSVPSGFVQLSRYSIINSGMCINVDAMMDCGGYNDAVFLDYSDHEFIRRFRNLYTTAFILDKEIYQDFSVVSDDKESTILRYQFFCKSISRCMRTGISDNFWYFVLILKRGLSICVRLRTMLPIKILWKDYL